MNTKWIKLTLLVAGLLLALALITRCTKKTNYFCGPAAIELYKRLMLIDDSQSQTPLER